MWSCNLTQSHILIFFANSTPTHFSTVLFSKLTLVNKTAIILNPLELYTNEQVPHKIGTALLQGKTYKILLNVVTPTFKSNFLVLINEKGKREEIIHIYF